MTATHVVGANDLAAGNLGPVYPLDPEETRNVGLNLAAHTLTHPCELDPDAGVTECGHPCHDRDVETCRFAVEVFGVAGAPPRSARQRVRSRSRGTCRVCGTRRYVTNAGVVLTHDTAAGDQCDGSLKPPAAAGLEVSLCQSPRVGSGRLGSVAPR